MIMKLLLLLTAVLFLSTRNKYVITSRSGIDTKRSASLVPKTVISTFGDLAIRLPTMRCNRGAKGLDLTLHYGREVNETVLYI